MTRNALKGFVSFCFLFLRMYDRSRNINVRVLFNHMYQLCSIQLQVFLRFRFLKCNQDFELICEGEDSNEPVFVILWSPYHDHSVPHRQGQDGAKAQNQ